MSSSSPDKDYLLKLSHYEEELIGDLSHQEDSMVLSKKLFEACILTGNVYDKFNNLDHSRIDHQLQIRYLLRLVAFSCEKDATKWKKFLKFLSSLGISSSLLDKLKVPSLSEIGLTNVGGSSAGSANMDPIKEEEHILNDDDVSILTEILTEVSYKWEEIAISLRLPKHKREQCRAGGTDKLKLCKCLELWIAGDDPIATLQALKNALKSKTVGVPRVAPDLEKKYKDMKYQNAGADKSETSLNLTSSGGVDSSLHISKKSRDTVVADGKTTLLMVQANPRESVSYQWKKDGQLLVNDSTYSGVTHDILVISNARPEMTGEYMCCVKKHKEEKNEKITLTVVNLTPKKPQPTRRSSWWSAARITVISAAVVVIVAVVAYYQFGQTGIAPNTDASRATPHRDLSSSRSAEHGQTKPREGDTLTTTPQNDLPSSCSAEQDSSGRSNVPLDGDAPTTPPQRDLSSPHSDKHTTVISHSSVPKISQMLSLTCGSETKSIIQEIAFECDTVGNLLEIPLHLVKSEWEIPGASNEQKCKKIIEQWLLGRGVAVKWSNVIDVLRKRGLNVLADFLENCAR